jgi:K+-sensing histidine kinase KdpD
MAMNERFQPSSSKPSSVDANHGNHRFFRALVKDHAMPTLIGMVGVIAITAIMMVFSDYFVQDHLIFFYLFPIIGISMYYSSAPALVMSLGSAIGIAYFLFPPPFSIRVSDPLQIAELLIFCIFAFIASKASSRLLH